MNMPLTLYDFLSEDEERERAYLINGVLPKKGLVVILGNYGTGKTQLAMRLACSIAAGSYFGEGKAPMEEVPLDFSYPTTNGYTLYFAGEGKSHIKSRIKASKLALSDHERSFIKEMLHDVPIVPVKINTPLDGIEKLKEIELIIQEARRRLPQLPTWPALIIFDTLSACFLIRDENNNSEMQRIAHFLHAIEEHYNCCVAVIAHPPKSNDAPKGYSRGASALVNSADIVIELAKINASKLRTVRILKMKDGPYEGASFKFKIHDFGFAPAFLPATDASQTTKQVKALNLSDKQKSILEALRKRADIPIKQSDFIEEILALHSNSTNLTSEKRMIRRDLKILESLGHLEKSGKGKEIFIVISKTENNSVGTSTDQIRLELAKDLFKNVIIPPFKK